MSLISEQGEGFCQSFLKKLENKKKSSGFLFLPTSASLTTFIGMCKIFLSMSEPFYLSTQLHSVFCAMYINLLDLFFVPCFIESRKNFYFFTKQSLSTDPHAWAVWWRLGKRKGTGFLCRTIWNISHRYRFSKLVLI